MSKLETMHQHLVEPNTPEASVCTESQSLFSTQADTVTEMDDDDDTDDNDDADNVNDDDDKDDREATSQLKKSVWLNVLAHYGQFCSIITCCLVCYANYSIDWYFQIPGTNMKFFSYWS